MHNVEYKIEKDKLIITIDVSAKTRTSAPPSASGKTKLVATTGAAQPLPGLPGVTFALNVMAK